MSLIVDNNIVELNRNNNDDLIEITDARLKTFKKFRKLYNQIIIDISSPPNDDAKYIYGVMNKFEVDGLYSTLLRTVFDFDHVYTLYNAPFAYTLVDGDNHNRPVDTKKQYPNLLNTTLYYPSIKNSFDLLKRETIRTETTMRVFKDCFHLLQKGGKLMTSIFNLETTNSWNTLVLGLKLFKKAYIFSNEKVIYLDYDPIITVKELEKESQHIFVPKTIYKALRKSAKAKIEAARCLLQKKYDQVLDSYLEAQARLLGTIKEQSPITYTEVYQQLMHSFKRVFVDHSIHRIHSGVNEQEGQFLQHLVETNKLTNICEIGMACGVSTSYLCHAVKTQKAGNVISIDPFQSTQWQNIGVQLIEHLGFHAIHKLLEEKSFTAMVSLYKSGYRADVCFIDGWHTFDYTLVDVFLCDMVLNVNGFIVIDDIKHKGVKSVIQYLKVNYTHYAQVTHGVPETMACFQKKRNDDREWYYHKDF